MAMYRKKPTAVIDAQQYLDPNNPVRGVRFDPMADGIAYVLTIHNKRAYVSVGDWIAAEPDGVHYYPIKDHVFRVTYEPA